MTHLSQNDMGRAFEYSVAMAMAQRLPADVETSGQQDSDMAAPMGLQNEYTAAVKAANKANGDVSRAEAALRMALAKAKK